MIKAFGEKDGKPYLLLGLDGENITRLVAGEPIAFDLVGEHSGRMRVGIFYGKTPEDLRARLAEIGVEP